MAESNRNNVMITKKNWRTVEDLNNLSNQNVRKVDKGTQVQAIFVEFCSETSVHGVRHMITQKKRHFIERIWWITAVLVSLIVCLYAISNIWFDWNDSPVLVSFNDKMVSISRIPFPAVTICSTANFNRESIRPDLFKKMLDHTEITEEELKAMTPEEFDKVDVYDQVCHRIKANLTNIKINRTEPMYETLRDVFQKPFLSSVTFATKPKKFHPIITQHGICYTFNSLNSEDLYTDEVAPELKTVTDNPSQTYWSVEKGYQPDVNESDIFPYRVFGVSKMETLSLRLNMNLNNFSNCGPLHGFKMFIFSPNEFPYRWSNDFVFVPIEQGMFISVKPRGIGTSEKLRSYPPKARGCVFQSEQKLRFFKAYSQLKCTLECATNYIHDSCGCVSFHMPRDNATRVCTMLDRYCLNESYERFIGQQLIITSCDCLPDCINLAYDAHVSQAPISLNHGGLGPEWNSSWMQMSFKEPQFIAINRTETQSFTDFVASCGGLLGLFMGISLMSIIELVYFFTLRLFCQMRQDRAVADTPSTWATKNTKQKVKHVKNSLSYGHEHNPTGHYYIE